ncbi:MAG TPA: sensor histidine kinase [Emticicia sp.]
MKNITFCFSVILTILLSNSYAQSVRLPNLNDTFKAADLARKPVNADSIFAATKGLFYSLEHKARNKKEDTLLVLAAERLAYMYYNNRIAQKNPDSMMRYAERLLKYATNIQYNTQVFKAYDYMGIAYTIKADYQKALDISLEANKKASNLKGADFILATYSLTRIASSYQLLRDYENSLVYHKKALEIISICRDNDLKTDITPEKVSKWALSYAYKFDDIGVIYAEQKQFAEAIKYYQQALNHIHEGKLSTSIEMVTLMEIGRCQIHLNRIEEGVSNVKKALKYFEDTNNRFYPFACYTYLAKAAYLSGDYPLAIQYAEKAETWAQAAMAIKHEVDTYEVKYLSAKKLQKYDLALSAYEKYNLMNDSISDRRKLTQVLGLQKKLETERAKAEFERQELLQKAIIDSSLRANEILLLKSRNAETERLALFEKNERDELARKFQIEQLKTSSEKTRLVQQNRIRNLSAEAEKKQQTQQFLWIGLGMLGLLLLSLAWNFRNIQKRKKETELLNEQLELKVRERTAELQKSYDEIKEAMQRGQTIERKRMAADLHDNLGSLLTAINISLDNISPEHLSEREQQIYANVLSMTENAYSEVRILSHNLMPEELEKEGLENALKRMIQKINHNQRIQFRLTIDELTYFNKNIDLNIYAICLELVQNIIKHSKATASTIYLSQKGKDLLLEVTDNGRGIQENQQKGIGLKNIQGRLETIGGELTIDSEKDKGTRFIILVPLTQNELLINSQ